MNNRDEERRLHRRQKRRRDVRDDHLRAFRQRLAQRLRDELEHSVHPRREAHEHDDDGEHGFHEARAQLEQMGDESPFRELLLGLVLVVRRAHQLGGVCSARCSGAGSRRRCPTWRAQAGRREYPGPAVLRPTARAACGGGGAAAVSAAVRRRLFELADLDLALELATQLRGRASRSADPLADLGGYFR